MSIDISNLSMVYKNGFKALDNVNIEIKEGVFGLLGQNGAGKTTLMKILSTILSQTEGEINIYGLKMEEENYSKIKNMVGYLPQELGLYPNLTVEESLDYIGMLCEIPRSIRKKRINDLLELTNLKNTKLKKISSYRVG